MSDASQSSKITPPCPLCAGDTVLKQVHRELARQFNVFFFSMPLKGSLAVLLLLIVMSNVADLVRMEVVNWPHQLQMLKGATNSH